MALAVLVRLFSVLSVIPLPNKFVYRALRVNGKECDRANNGESLSAVRPTAEASIREHVLHGSGSKWQGTQFISTTTDLDVAIRFAAPCNQIIRIDLDRYQGEVIDLSTDAAFGHHIPPSDADLRPNDHAAECFRAGLQVKLSTESGRSHWMEEEDPATVAKDVQWFYEQAAVTPWECARLFATRSKEVLLRGEIPHGCYELLDYEVRTTAVDYIQGHGLPVLPPLERIDAFAPCDGDYEGLFAFEVEGQDRHFHLKKARANVAPSLLDASGMREAIDHEFAAFQFYRMVEAHVPSMAVHVRDCAKISF